MLSVETKLETAPSVPCKIF